jgi:hypothetical protein
MPWQPFGERCPSRFERGGLKVRCISRLLVHFKPSTKAQPSQARHRFSSAAALAWLAATNFNHEKVDNKPHHKQRSCRFFRARTMTVRTLAKREISISRWRHSPSLQEVPIEVGEIEITHLVTNTRDRLLCFGQKSASAADT